MHQIDVDETEWDKARREPLKNSTSYIEQILEATSNQTVVLFYPTPPLGQDMTQGQFLRQSLTGLNSEFSFS